MPRPSVSAVSGENNLKAPPPSPETSPTDTERMKRKAEVNQLHGTSIVTPSDSDLEV
jgi:hypothetical protein